MVVTAVEVGDSRASSLSMTGLRRLIKHTRRLPAQQQYTDPGSGVNPAVPCYLDWMPRTCLLRASRDDQGLCQRHPEPKKIVTAKANPIASARLHREQARVLPVSILPILCILFVGYSRLRVLRVSAVPNVPTARGPPGR